MVDYSVDETFDLYFDENKDFAIVEGREEFQEDLTVRMDEEFSEVVGGYRDTNTVIERLELMASRLAKEFEIIDDIQRIFAYEPLDKPETIALEITYATGDTFEETL